MTDLTEEQIEAIQEEGTVLFAIGWDSGAPGPGADVERVYEHQGNKYIFWSSGEIDGPFPSDSLSDIIKREGLLTITDAVTGVRIANISEAEMVELAVVVTEPGHEFEINDKMWRVDENQRLVKI